MPRTKKEPELTEAQVAKFSEAYSMYSSRGKADGLVRPAELPNLMRACGMNPTVQEVTDIVDGMDENLEGLINLKVFLKMMLDYIVAKGDEDLEEKLREAFKAFDLENNGFMETGVFIQTMVTLGDCLTPHEAKAMVKVADKDRSGMINCDEFIMTLLRY